MSWFWCCVFRDGHASPARRLACAGGRPAPKPETAPRPYARPSFRGWEPTSDQRISASYRHLAPTRTWPLISRLAPARPPPKLNQNDSNLTNHEKLRMKFANNLALNKKRQKSRPCSAMRHWGTTSVQPLASRRTRITKQKQTNKEGKAGEMLDNEQ